MDLPKLRTSGQAGPAQAAGDASLPAPFPVNALAELVADLIETTGLIPADKLALVRGRVKQGGSFAQAVLDENVASPDGIARTLASRFHLPFVELPVIGVNDEAAQQLPLHVLERVSAVPYALEGNILRVAVADPSNVQAIDELSLGTKCQVELAVASREEIANELKQPLCQVTIRLSVSVAGLVVMVACSVMGVFSIYNYAAGQVSNHFALFATASIVSIAHVRFLVSPQLADQS